MELNVEDMGGGYVTVVQHVAREGRKATSRGLQTRELVGATIIIPDVRCRMLPVKTGRGVNLRLAAVEALQLIAGVSRPDLIQKAAPDYAQVLVSGEDVKAMDYAAYGPRVRDQLSDLVSLLRHDPGSRQAVLQIWRSDDLGHAGDKPCTLSLQFLVRAGRLHMVSTMRSQDVILGLCYDLFMFTQLQWTLARALTVGVGGVTHHVGSLHVYESDMERVRQLSKPPTHVADASPCGVLPVDPTLTPGPLTPWRTAQALLDGAAVARASNPWYTSQLEKLGVYDMEKMSS